MKVCFEVISTLWLRGEGWWNLPRQHVIAKRPYAWWFCLAPQQRHLTADLYRRDLTLTPWRSARRGVYANETGRTLSCRQAKVMCKTHL
jgi:hypothetical protein